MRVFFFLWAIQAYAVFNLTWGIPAVNLDSNPPIGDTDADAFIAIDPFGNAIATWRRTVDQRASEDIWTSLYNHSSRVWSGPFKVSGGGSAADARVAIDEEGNAVFVWQEGFPTQIFFRTLSANGVWEPPLELPPLPVQSSKNPQTACQIVAAPNGQFLLLWSELSKGHFQIHSAQKTAETPNWLDLGAVSSNANSAILKPLHPLAINASGQAIATWQESDGTVYGAAYSQGAWTQPFSIAPGQNASVGMDNQGRALFVWNGNNQVQSCRFVDGVLSPIFLISDPSYNALHPDVGVDAEGNAIAVFERHDTMNKFIAAATLPANETTWSTPVDISGPSASVTDGAGYPVLSLNSIGDGVVIWKEFDGSNIVIQGAGYSVGTWSFIRTLSTLGDNAGAPLPAYDIGVAINASGNILAIWPEDSSGRGTQQIKATTGVGLANLGPTPPKIDPITLQMGIASGEQIYHRFAAHGDLINILSWSSSSGNVAYYNIYRGSLKNLIGQTTTTRFEDHQRTPKKRELYFISAVDSNGQESSPITLFVNTR